MTTSKGTDVLLIEATYGLFCRAMTMYFLILFTGQIDQRQRPRRPIRLMFETNQRALCELSFVQPTTWDHLPRVAKSVACAQNKNPLRVTEAYKTTPTPAEWDCNLLQSYFHLNKKSNFDDAWININHKVGLCDMTVSDNIKTSICSHCARLSFSFCCKLHP